MHERATLIQKSICPDSIVSNSNSTVPFRRLFQHYRPGPDIGAARRGRESMPWLFGDHSSCWVARRLFRRRDHECDPCIPAIGPVCRVELRIGFEVHIALQIAERDDVTDLRPDADYLRLEATYPIAGAAVATELIVDIADYADLNLLGQELRRAPIEVHVDAVLVIGGLVREI